MKKITKILSLVLFVFALVITLGITKVKAAVTVTKVTDLSEIETGSQVVITTTFDGTNYILPNATSTSSGPVVNSTYVFTDAPSVDVADTNKWTVTKNGENYQFTNSEGKYLSSTSNSNSGLRVNTTECSWAINATNEDGMFSMLSSNSSRYLGIYNTKDWRTYTSATATNYKESAQSIVFYKYENNSSALATPSCELEGTTLTITASDQNATGYTVGFFNDIADTIPHKSYDTESTTFTLPYLPQAKLFIRVKAIDNTNNYNDSEWSVADENIFYENTVIKAISVEEFNALEKETSAPYTDYQVTGVIANKEASGSGFELLDANDETIKLEVSSLSEYEELGLQEGYTLTLTGHKSSSGLLTGTNYVSHTINYLNVFTALDTQSSMNVTFNKVISTQEGTSQKTTTTYTFSDYTAGTQYAVDEVHVLDNDITITTTECHFTSELRIYSSSAHDGYAVIESKREIESITLNVGNNADTLNVYGSTDGTTWTLVKEITTTSSYTDYIVEFAETFYKYLKLDVAGTKQVRIKNFTMTLLPSNESIEVINYTFSNFDIRFGLGDNFTEELYNNLNQYITANEGVIKEFGVAAVQGDAIIFGDGSTAIKQICQPDETSKAFALLLTNVPSSDYNQLITAAAYVCVTIGGNDVYYYTNTATYSIVTLAQQYRNNTNVSAEHKEMLTYFIDNVNKGSSAE